MYNRGRRQRAQPLRSAAPIAGAWRVLDFSFWGQLPTSKRVPWPYLPPPTPSNLKKQAWKCSIWDHAFCLDRITINVAVAFEEWRYFLVFSNSTKTECMVCNMHHLIVCILCPQKSNFSCLETDTIPVFEVREVSLCNSAKNCSKMNFKPHF